MPSHRNHLDSQIVWLAALDALCLLIGFLAGIILRLGPDALGANYVAGTYGLEIRLSRFNMLVNWAFSVTTALLVVATTSYAWFDTVLGRGVLALSLGMYSVLWLSLRMFIYHYLFRTEQFAYRVVILGTGPTARNILAMVASALLRPAHRVVALIQFADAEGAAGPTPDRIAGVPVIRTATRTLAAALRPLNADVVLIGLDQEAEAARAYPQLRRLRFEGVAVLNTLNVVEVYGGRIPLDLVDELWLMQASMGSASPVLLRFKRMLDVALAAPALVLALPAMLLVAAAIKLSALRQPVLYSQDRAGRFGRPFRIHKFRTMIPGAEPAGSAIWSPPDDARITRVGRVLRRYRLDELPQLVNVIKGEMSLVGPRPERPELVAELDKQIPYYR